MSDSAIRGFEDEEFNVASAGGYIHHACEKLGDALYHIGQLTPQNSPIVKDFKAKLQEARTLLWALERESYY